MVGTRISVTAGLSMAFRKSCAISPCVDTRTPCAPKDNAKRSNAIGPSELAVGTPNWRDAVFRAGGMFLRVEGNQKEPLDKRIIETPEDVEGTEGLCCNRKNADLVG